MSSRVHLILSVRELYELNLGTFNSIFGFLPSIDLPNQQVLLEFNPNAFWGELSGNVRYNTSTSKCTLFGTLTFG